MAVSQTSIISSNSKGQQNEITHRHNRLILFSKKFIQKKGKIRCRKMRESLPINDQQPTEMIKVTTFSQKDNLSKRSITIL